MRTNKLVMMFYTTLPYPPVDFGRVVEIVKLNCLFLCSVPSSLSMKYHRAVSGASKETPGSPLLCSLGLEAVAATYIRNSILNRPQKHEGISNDTLKMSLF